MPTFNQANLPFFQEPSPTVAGAIKALAASKRAAPAYLDVVRQITATLSAMPSGRVIVAVVPNADAAGWLSEAIADYYSELKLAKGEEGSIAIIDLPSVWTAREQARSILAAYVGMPLSLVRHSYQPQFELAFGSASAGTSPVNQVYSVVASQSTACYILRNTEKLAESSTTRYQEIERLKFFIEVSRNTGKRHVLVTQARYAAQWLEDPEVAGAVEQFWIKPYSRDDDKSFAEFEGILAGFDVLIPREPGFALVDHAEEIHRVVWGCPTRAKRWVERVLTLESDSKLEHFSWKHFVDRSPRGPQIDQAKEEYELIAKATTQPLLEEWKKKNDGGETTATGTSKTKPKRPVGQRALGRDRVAQPDEDAA